MLVSEFDYFLPPELIAQRPLPRRDDSRMMVVLRREGKIIHSRFKDFPDFLHKGDVLILNSVKVIPAKVWGKKGDSDIEFLFLKEQEEGVWEVLCRPAKKIRLGDRVFFAPRLEGQVVEEGPEGKRTLRFSTGDVLGRLKEIGFAPLPPYIKRRKMDRGLRDFDLERYQTLFAKRPGAIAAPTAGLHFTPEVLAAIRKKGIALSPINLEVGLATFQPVRVERIEDHKMLEERYTIGRDSAQIINRAKMKGQPVAAVGTTVVRALESAVRGRKVLAGTRSTKLFISPGYEFKAVDRLLTNFHLPKSTLLMLVSAFASTDLIKKAYAEAVRATYRFYSYGDCMFII